MYPARRKFLHTSIVFSGVGALAPSLLGSCISLGGKEKMTIAFIGPQENFKSWKPHFRDLKGMTLEFSSLEMALSGEAAMVFLDSDSSTKSSYIIMLMEQGLDVLTTYPMGYSLGEYASLLEFMERHQRIIGLLNPLLFYPSIQLLEGMIREKSVELTEIRINSNPFKLDDQFHVSGLTGTAQPLQRVASFISGSYPVSLMAKAKQNGELNGVWLDYESFKVSLRLDPEQIGWNMEILGREFLARTDHTGMLGINNEIEPRYKPDPGVMQKSILMNLNDFMESVKERSNPIVNSLDALAAIRLNDSVEKSLQSRSMVQL
jgi:predicted dehydrogenase